MKAATDKLSLTLRAISDPTRRKIIRLLRTSKLAASGQPNGLNASDLEKRTKLAQPTVSHHMKVLIDAGLVEMDKKGTWVWYIANRKALTELSKAIAAEL